MNSGAIASSPSSPDISSRPVEPHGRRLEPWLVGAAVATWRCLVLSILAVAGIGSLLALVLIVLIVIALILKLLGPSRAIHALNNHASLALILSAVGLLVVRLLPPAARHLVGKWTGVPIRRPYRTFADAGDHGLTELWRRTTWLATDPATWRDLVWLAVNACAGFVLVATPVAFVGDGLASIWRHGLMLAPSAPHGYVVVKGMDAIPIGLGLMAAGLLLAPRLLGLYNGMARVMLAPPRAAHLASQVSHLAQSRSETVDAGAAELRRIERDLHDGAQARLVAMGMTLDTAGRLLDHDPAAARSLLLEARESSVVALAELRNLVRGIHPPVLADRGLPDAIRAVAMDVALPVHCTIELAARPPAPVESAAYFAICELLANATKHSGARRAWIDVRHEAGMLRISVGDDGRGGAEPSLGTGLQGIERRLAAFDGVLALSSPVGGPTIVNLEIPCALSSPKTSSS